jgi:hypothetical protein
MPEEREMITEFVELNPRVGVTHMKQRGTIFLAIRVSIYPTNNSMYTITYCNYIYYNIAIKFGRLFFYIIFYFFNFLTYPQYPYILNTYMVL